MIRLAIIAPHFPEYSVQYGIAMSRHFDVLAYVDQYQLQDEFLGRMIPDPVSFRLETGRFKTARDLWHLLTVVRRFQPDIVHIQEAAGPRRAFFTAFIARVMRPSALVVLTVHDPVSHGGRDQAAARRTAPIVAYVRRVADLIVVHGEFCKRLLQSQRMTKGRQIVVSSHGLILEPAVLRPPPSGPFKMFFFGRMELYKGLEILLLAVEMLDRDGFPFELSVAGSGPELDRLQDRFARLPQVTVSARYVPPCEIMAAIQAADCVILPYLSATQSGVLAAAFAGHRYVIASDTGGLPDVVRDGDNGLLVRAGDAESLATAIRRVAFDPALQVRLRRGAERTARSQLDWAAICGVLVETFRGSMRARSPARARKASGPPPCA